MLWTVLFLCVISIITTLSLTLLLLKEKKKENASPLLDTLDRFDIDLRHLRQENIQNINRAVSTLGQNLMATQGQFSKEFTSRQDSMQRTVIELTRNIDEALHRTSLQTQHQLSEIRQVVDHQLAELRTENAHQLEQMRLTVDEKLQTTLESRLGQSFSLVSSRLEQVYKGLGEMHHLAEGVGDLKKVLSNVKTRGVLGEVQLGAILEQLLAPEQYCANVATKAGSRAFVEYAVLLPGDGQTSVYLPIDAKFPADAYQQLVDAIDEADITAIAAAKTQLSNRIRSFARDIHEKYIDPPHTTDFAILFLPFEGLFAQVLQLNLLEPLQREFKITVTGPTTMAALLNSLQMGFRTLAIQKRSGEVWNVLGAVRTEFDRFGDVLGAARQRLEQTNAELDKLVGVRTRMIQKQLSQIDSIDDSLKNLPV